MSIQILAESVISVERTLVYQTVFENFVVLIQQKRQGDVWQTYQHCLIPKLFINAIASLPEKTEVHFAFFQEFVTRQTIFFNRLLSNWF